ncbi:aspartate--tRNA ligase [Candidatus Viadribacter manganicus]|uniref:Aspartate--tRNA ligase n=1 Tax=Candidatus Viadribacter manganicus TaxID=1759059 RepID=A0A1B1ADW7_9PROT|nr:aspartate--tRNA ligase [Candidatus Viadribacter manganicus]ANP44748.1 aspartyl-tRNA synthetase [Candidatus Viadribacter manganicus]
MHAYRSHTCGALRPADAGKDVRLGGWVHRKRDLGGLLFVDLRDHYGITQLVINPGSAAFPLFERLRAETVVRIDGKVIERAKDTVNPELPTGEIEVRVEDAEVLGSAEELPLPVFGAPDYPEEIRLKYRFLDLRRDKLHKSILLRSQVIASLRRRMIDQGFTEFQTPILTASSPEGARDFLVPSRLHPGKFYALPQAPQQFKQLLMVAGFDKYFQIAPCFRDEDARADRSPGEFYQLDFEMSFVTQEDVFNAIGPVLAGVFEEFGNGKRVTPADEFPRIPYAEAISKYGSDKPDLRNPLVLQDVSEHFRGGGFGLFARLLEKAGNAVWAVPAPTGGSRAFCDKMNSWAQGEGQPGLGYIFWREGEEGGAGPIAKNIGPEKANAIREQLGLKVGDAAFFVAGDPAVFYKFAGQARNKVADELNLSDKDQFKFCWIVDFPMYEWSEEEKKIDFSHNPFSMPNFDHEAFLKLDVNDRATIEKITAFQYDIVCNGVELSSGAIRNHKPEIMIKAFEIAGYGKEVVEEKFGGMLNAFRYGAPPHGGSAPGVDRIVMLLAGVDNIREVIVFPFNQQAQDLMMNAPGEVTPKQLKELHIRLAEAPKS